MSKIIFVNPPFTVWDSETPLPRTLENTTPSFGLCCLAAVVREKGHTARIVEAGALQLTMKETLAHILKERPDIVGFRASTVSLNNAALLAKAIKEVDAKVLTIIGGPHITAEPRATLSRFPQFDLAVIGEGEQTLVELLAVIAAMGIQAHEGIKDVLGIAFRGNNGEIVLTAKRPYIKDLDSLPMPAWDLLEGFPDRYQPPLLSYKSLPVASMVTSRGCPFQCTFCDRSVFGNRYRGYSAAYMTRLIKHLVSVWGIKHLLFYDDLFAASETRLNAVCNDIISNGLNVSWSCDARVNAVTEKTLALMKKAGCWEIAFGIESGSQKILDLVAKDITIKDIETGVRLTHEAGIKVKGLFMMGHPGETRETIRETVQLATRLPFDIINISKLTPYPGTALYKDAAKYGTFDPDWDRMNSLSFVFVPHGFTREALEAEYRMALKKFYWRPGKTIALIGALMRDRAGLKRLLKAQNDFLRFKAGRYFRKAASSLGFGTGTRNA